MYNNCKFIFSHRFIYDGYFRVTFKQGIVPIDSKIRSSVIQEIFTFFTLPDTELSSLQRVEEYYLLYYIHIQLSKITVLTYTEWFYVTS